MRRLFIMKYLHFKVSLMKSACQGKCETFLGKGFCNSQSYNSTLILNSIIIYFLQIVHPCTLRKKSLNYLGFLHTLRFSCFVHRIEVGNLPHIQCSSFLLRFEVRRGMICTYKILIVTHVSEWTHADSVVSGQNQ